MKQGMTFDEVVEQVERDASNRRDFYMPTSEMTIATDGQSSCLKTPCGQFAMRETAHLHLAEMCGIDRRYYQRLRTEAPGLLDDNVNYWLTHAPSKSRVVRALEGPEGSLARAIVSTRYATLDNDALLRTVEPITREMDLKVESCDVGAQCLVIKMVSPRLTGTVQVGDDVQAGIILRNSEVRCSSLQIGFFFKRLVCTNGMIVQRNDGQSTSRRHTGRDWQAAALRSGEGNIPNFGELPINEDRTTWERAIWQSMQQEMRERLNTDEFQKMLARFAQTTTLRTALEPDQIVKRVADAFYLHETEQSAMLSHLARDGHTTLWGVLNAVTRTAQDAEDYGRATRLEELGGRLTALSSREWERLVSPN